MSGPVRPSPFDTPHRVSAHLPLAHRDQLIGHIQKFYGIAREEAERQVSDFERSLDSSARH